MVGRSGREPPRRSPCSSHRYTASEEAHVSSKSTSNGFRSRHAAPIERAAVNASVAWAMDSHSLALPVWRFHLTTSELFAAGCWHNRMLLRTERKLDACESLSHAGSELFRFCVRHCHRW